MQIDVNSVADRVQLIRTQSTTAKGPQFDPKTVVDSARNKFASKASSAVENIPGIRTPRSISSAVPARPQSSLPVEPNTSADTSRTPEPEAEPTTRLEALLADWGQADSPYDLDGNGIVGAGDLLMLLAQMGGGGAQQPQKTPANVVDPQRLSVTAADHPLVSDPSSADNEPANRLEALLADWGTTDSPYDLDGNGIVGAGDLLMLLAQMGGGGAQQPQDPHGDVADRQRASSQAPVETPAPPNMPYSSPIIPSQAVAIGVKTTAIAQDVIDKLDQDKNGTISTSEVNGSTQAFDRLDRNQDGALSRSELASQIRNMLLDHLAKNPNANLHQFVQEAMKLLSDRDEDNKGPSKRNSAVERSSSIYRQANLKATARQLVQGLTDQGAMELRKFVQAGELSANEKRTVLDQISHLRPGAQRVNLVG